MVESAKGLAGLKRHFGELADPRVERQRKHELLDIVVMGTCATIAGCETFVQMAEYARCKQDWFAQFLALPNGIPSHDTFNRVFARLKPTAFQDCFVGWLMALQEELGDHICIDGKTLRHTFDKAAGKTPLHLVSAWAAEASLTLGQVAVDAKSNEITAIPKLLQLVDLDGMVVTIDAAGCQREIASQIVAGGGAYMIAVKGNQPTLHAAVADAFTAHLESSDATVGSSYHRHAEKRAHGRDTTREVHVIAAPTGLQDLLVDWAACATFVMVITYRRLKGQDQPEPEFRYYISSLKTKSARRCGRYIRRHWSIENSLHWILDVAFREDALRMRKDHAAENIAMLNRIALSLLKQDTTTKAGIDCKRKKAGWDNEYLLHILKAQQTLQN